MGNDPDWLPEGWGVSVSVRGSGKRDKYYINLSNGLKYNSKTEVLRYLKNAGKKHQSKELRSMDKQSDVVIEKIVADNLPPGWIKEIRTKKKGGKARRDPYYIDPISGRHFRSMQEVSRYLETIDSGRAERKPDDKSHVNQELGDQFESSSTGTNRDRFNKRLINKRGDKNATGNKRLTSELELAACSKVTATSNDDLAEESCLGQRAKVDNSHAVELYDKLQPINTVGERENIKDEIKNSPDNEADKNADQDQSLNLGSTGARMEHKAWNIPIKLPLAIDMESGTIIDKRLAVNDVESSVVEDKRLAVNDVESSVVEDLTLQSGSERFPMKIVSKAVINGLEEGEKEDSVSVVLQDTPPKVNKNDEKLGHKNKRKRLSGKWMNNLPRRTSKRLTRAEADSSPQVKTRNNAEAEAPLSCEAETNSAEKVVNCDPAEEHSTDWRSENPTNNKQKDLDVLPSRDDEKIGKHLDSSLNDLLMDPCIEFAIKTLTGVVPIEDMNEVKDCPLPSNPSPNQISDSGFSSVLPLGDLWSDPCFEFAVKTLTGEIPMECSSHTQVSLEQPSSSSRSSYCNGISLPQFRLNTFCPSSYLYTNTFIASETPQIGIQFPPLPHQKNGSSGFY